MDYEEAIKHIVENWESLQDGQSKTLRTPETIAVWCAKSDTAGSYEVDEEWIGVTPQGGIAWAYASGCSCWDGNFDEERHASVKELTLQHDHPPEDWEKAIIKFAETHVMQEL